MKGNINPNILSIIWQRRFGKKRDKKNLMKHNDMVWDTMRDTNE